MRKIFNIILLITIFTFSTVLSGCGENSGDTVKQEEKISDTVFWINGTYAILTSANNGDINKVGGFEKNPANIKTVQSLLKEWWDIENKEDAVETINWLLNNGDRNYFVTEAEEYGINEYTREELNDDISELEPEDQIYYNVLFNAYEKYQENAISAWDYCRATQLLGYFYVADYYTYEEALDKSLEVAKLIQSTYSSWDDMVQSYLYGFQYWNNDDINNKESESYKRSQIYSELKNKKGVPYVLDWNMELVKEW